LGNTHCEGDALDKANSGRYNSLHSRTILNRAFRRPGGAIVNLSFRRSEKVGCAAESASL
jgi:hypothetical protein